MGVYFGCYLNFLKGGENVLGDYRRLFRLTKQQAADIFSISLAYWTMIENHKRYPGLVLADRMSRFYGASIDCLFFSQNTHTLM